MLTEISLKIYPKSIINSKKIMLLNVTVSAFNATRTCFTRKKDGRLMG